MSRLLMVEDDPHISDVVEFLMQEEGHQLDRATDGRQGWALYQKNRYALVLLDLGLPGIGGWELFERIRGRQPEQPLVMLTAQGEEPERVKGLTLGADDYIAKPFSNPELVARVRNLLRRTRPLPEQLICGPLRLFPESGELTVRGRELILPPHEFALLRVLMTHSSRVFSRETLLDHMYDGIAECNDRTVDQAVKRLRKKLKPLLDGENAIETHYGLGYRISESLRRESL